MKRKTRRLYFVIFGLICCALAAYLVLSAFSSNIVFFVTPSQLKTQSAQNLQNNHHAPVKLGGMVVAGSVKKIKNGDEPVNIFSVTDGQAAITVHFKGILPDLFREGQSVVAIGSLQQNPPFFQANEVLAKHDETYMPPEVAQALKKSGRWDPRFGPPPDAKSWNNMIAPTKNTFPQNHSK